MDYLVSMFVHRPYVVILVLMFMLVAAAERGLLRMTLWLIVGTFLGWLFEFVSVRTGFPFSWYEYYPASFPDELWLGGIPLFASLSFAALSYFGFSMAYTLLAALDKGEQGITRREDTSLALSTKVAICAAVLTTWTDFVVDPVAHLGEFWFLGKIYFWITTSTAWHFDVPLWNYLGWLITIFTIVRVNQLTDALLIKASNYSTPAFSLPHLCLWSVGYFVGNFIFILSVNVYLYFNPDVPADRQIGLVLANTAVFVVAFVAFVITVLKHKLRSSMSRQEQPNITGSGRPHGTGQCIKR